MYYTALTFRKRQPSRHHIPPRLCNRSRSRSYAGGCTNAAPSPWLSQTGTCSRGRVMIYSTRFWYPHPLLSLSHS